MALGLKLHRIDSQQGIPVQVGSQGKQASKPRCRAHQSARDDRATSGITLLRSWARPRKAVATPAACLTTSTSLAGTELAVLQLKS